MFILVRFIVTGGYVWIHFSGSSPDEVDFLNWPNPSGRTGPGVDSASNRRRYQESLKIKKPGGKVRPARRADNLAAIY
jgi:hypothetical protein